MAGYLVRFSQEGVMTTSWKEQVPKSILADFRTYLQINVKHGRVFSVLGIMMKLVCKGSFWVQLETYWTP